MKRRGSSTRSRPDRGRTRGGGKRLLTSGSTGTPTPTSIGDLNGSGRITGMAPDPGGTTATRDRSAEFLGQRDDDTLGAAEVAEQEHVLVPHHLADELGAMGPQAGD